MLDAMLPLLARAMLMRYSATLLFSPPRCRLRRFLCLMPAVTLHMLIIDMVAIYAAAAILLMPFLRERFRYRRYGEEERRRLKTYIFFFFATCYFRCLRYCLLLLAALPYIPYAAIFHFRRLRHCHFALMLLRLRDAP